MSAWSNEKREYIPDVGCMSQSPTDQKQRVRAQKQFDVSSSYIVCQRVMRGGERGRCELDFAGPCMPCQGAGVLINVCDEEPSKSFSSKLTYFKISLIAGEDGFYGDRARGKERS